MRWYRKTWQVSGEGTARSVHRRATFERFDVLPVGTEWAVPVFASVFQRTIYRAGPLATRFASDDAEVRLFSPQRRGAGNVRRDVQRAKTLRAVP